MPSGHFGLKMCEKRIQGNREETELDVGFLICAEVFVPYAIRGSASKVKLQIRGTVCTVAMRARSRMMLNGAGGVVVRGQADPTLAWSPRYKLSRPGSN